MTSRDPIPHDAKAARNLRRHINRAIKGCRPFDSRSPIRVSFQDGITDSFCVSNLDPKDSEEVARQIDKWDYAQGGFVWRAGTCYYLITPMNGPLRIHPRVLVASLGLKAYPRYFPSYLNDPRVRKHFEALEDSIRHDERNAAEIAAKRARAA